MSELSPEAPELNLLFDPGNPYAPNGVWPSYAVFGRQDSSAGSLLVVTIRSGPASLTLKQPRDEAIRWANLWRENAKNLPALLVPPGGLLVPTQGPNGQPAS